MTTEYSAKYFDGKTSLPYQAKVQLNDKGVVFHLTKEDNEISHFWSFSDLILISGMKDNMPGVFSTMTEPLARLLIHNELLYAEVLKHLPKDNVKKSEVSHSWGLLTLIALGCVVGFILALFFIPFAAPLAAKIIPASWDDRLGQWVIKDIVEEQHQCVAKEGTEALNKLVHKLVPNSNVPFDVRVVKVKGFVPNAFAVPGYHIVVFDSLLNYADNPDEVAGVLAHEMGHALYHHPTAGVLRQIGFKAVMIGAFGSTSDVASTLLDLQYTRKNEMQADEVATQLLQSSQISNKGFAAFFQKLRSQFGQQKGIMRYLASHPGLEQRVEFVLKQPEPEKPQPSLSPEEWHALKNICKETKPLKFDTQGK